MKKVWAMYFSGTGTTQKTVTFLATKTAEKLDAKYEEFDFTTPGARKKTQNFGKDDIVFWGTPVIAGRVPNLLLDYLNSLEGNGALGIPVVLFGNRDFDDALIELRNIMESDGFDTIAGGAFVGEHSFSTILGGGRPDAEDMKEDLAFAEAIVDAIKKLPAGSKKSGPVEVKGEDPIRPYYMPRDRKGNHIDIRKVKPKTNDNCTNCGLCAELCALGSIDKDDCSKIPGICMKCSACIKKCPQHAKYFDDKGYLYHINELEEMYAGRRAKNEWFVI